MSSPDIVLRSDALQPDQVRLHELCEEIEECLFDLRQTFLASRDLYFFTEKEVHSYFYSILAGRPSFMNGTDFNIVHTEYPTPFRCNTSKQQPYIEIAEINSGATRGHIDLVIMNPAYVEWASTKSLPSMALTGIGKGLFSKYVLDLYSIYEQFNDERKQSVLLYAIEFKYLRHAFVGKKYPEKEVLQDSTKLALIKNLKNPFTGKKIDFVQNLRSIVLVGTECKGIVDTKREEWSSPYIEIIVKD
jgi:hypothetical protein